MLFTWGVSGAKNLAIWKIVRASSLVETVVRALRRTWNELAVHGKKLIC
jgi:hypothetical protein